jgi:hypothetical protein
MTNQIEEKLIEINRLLGVMKARQAQEHAQQEEATRIGFNALISAPANEKYMIVSTIDRVPDNFHVDVPAPGQNEVLPGRNGRSHLPESKFAGAANTPGME